MGDVSIHTATEITLDFDTDYKYSICTLVTDKAEYQEMITSFIAAGFDTSFCEYIYIDNSSNNKSDAYLGLNYFLQKAKGKYIILCHQDILLCYDKIGRLEQVIADLNSLDPNWAIMSNAGASGVKDVVYRIYEPNNIIKRRGHPIQKVVSVDENFILVKKSANLALSNNIGGFHLYGADLCIVASVLGFNAYVVEFLLLHKSRGNVDISFHKIKRKLESKYQNAFTGRFIETTCTSFYLSGNKRFNDFVNSKFAMFFVRNYYSIKKKTNKKVQEIPKSEW